MYPFLISQNAWADIDDIAGYISQDNPARAETFIDELYAKVIQIAERPLSFPLKPEIAPAIRSALYGKYLILYKTEDETVYVMRIVHGARDLQNLL